MDNSSGGFVGVSAIVPTIGRPESLSRLLDSLASQSRLPDEVIVADGSDGSEVQSVIDKPEWIERGLAVRRISVQPPNAVKQRRAAIDASHGEHLLLLDDDVVLEPVCVAQMLLTMQSAEDVVGVFADFNNQSWPMPTHAWRFYLRHVLGMREGTWQGKVVGPLLRFGYNPPPTKPMPIDWLGTCNSMIRRAAFHSVGGFSDFFLHRCTMNEDVDLGLKLSRVGRILFCPAARMAHFHAPGGRVSTAVAAEDDLFNRYLVLRETLKRNVARACGLVALFFLLETTSNFLGCLRRGNFGGFFQRFRGRLKALGLIAKQIIFGNDPDTALAKIRLAVDQ